MENYPGQLSENYDYYKKFNKEKKEKYRYLESMANLILGGELVFKKNKGLFVLQKVEDVDMTDKLFDLLLAEGFDLSEDYKIAKMIFYNNKLYQGKVVSLIYNLNNGKIKIYGAIEAGQVYKFETPQEINLDLKYSIGEKVSLLLGCHNYYIEVKGNKVLVYYEKIKQKKKEFKNKLGKIEISFYKKRERKLISYITLGKNGGIIRNRSGKVIGRVEIYGNDWIILDNRGQILADGYKEKTMNIQLPTNEKIILKFK